jgi:CrcB protein
MSVYVFVAVGVGGAIGSILRLYINGLVNNNLYFLSLPLGTIFVNLIGSFLIGIFFSIFHNIQIEPYIKSFLTTGLLGGLTTFSTFSYETLLLLESGNLRGALLNISLNLIGSLIMVWLGSKILN